MIKRAKLSTQSIEIISPLLDLELLNIVCEKAVKLELSSDDGTASQKFPNYSVHH